MDAKTLAKLAYVDKRRAGYEAVAKTLTSRHTQMEDVAQSILLEAGLKKAELDSDAATFPLLDVILDELNLLGAHPGLWSCAVTTKNGACSVADLVSMCVRTFADRIGEMDVKVLDDKAKAEIRTEYYPSAQNYKDGKIDKDGEPDNDRMLEAIRNYTDKDGNRPYESLVKLSIHPKTLKSITDELRGTGEDLPGKLKEAIKLAKVTSVKTRGA